MDVYRYLSNIVNLVLVTHARAEAEEGLLVSFSDQLTEAERASPGQPDTESMLPVEP